MMVAAQWTLYILAVALLTHAGCAAFRQATGVDTYIIPQPVWEDIRQQLQAHPCPVGQSAVAVAVEAPSGGGTLSVRCQ